MSLRFRKSVKLAPGVKLNLGKKSAGISVGGKYGGISVNSRTGVGTRVSAPGTGISYTNKITTKSKSKKVNESHDIDPSFLNEQGELDLFCDAYTLSILTFDGLQNYYNIVEKAARKEIESQRDLGYAEKLTNELKLIKHEFSKRAEHSKNQRKNKSEIEDAVKNKWLYLIFCIAFAVGGLLVFAMGNGGFSFVGILCISFALIFLIKFIQGMWNS